VTLDLTLQALEQLSAADNRLAELPSECTGLMSLRSLTLCASWWKPNQPSFISAFKRLCHLHRAGVPRLWGMCMCSGTVPERMSDLAQEGMLHISLSALTSQ
jgi:hypothetical protein